MAVNDQDLELMEQWLDGELTEADAEALRQRLAGEPQLAGALDRMRGDRKMRSEIFAALEPTHHDVDALINNVRSAVRKEEVWAWRMRTLRQVSGVAAAIAMVFTAGWISRSKLHVGPLPERIDMPSSYVVVHPSSAGVGVGAPEVTPVGTGTIGSTAQVRSVDANGFTKVRPTFRVYVVDPMNRIVGVKEMDNVADAKRLAVDFANFTDSRQPAPAPVPGQPPPTFINQGQP